VSKRNDIVDQVLAQLRAATTGHLAALDDEVEIVRGPADVRALEGIEFHLQEAMVHVDLGEDVMAPATVSKDGHEMAFFVLCMMRGVDEAEGLEDVTDFGDECERAVLSDRTLGGEVHECHPVRFTPGFLKGDSDVIAFAQVEFTCDFQTTD